MKNIFFTVGLLLLIYPFTASSQMVEKLSLADAISEALQHNPQILSAQKEIDAAEGRILQAGKIPNPELGLSWSETPLNFNIGDADERDIGISQQIEFPTKRSKRIEVATDEKQIVLFRSERLKTLVTAQVKKAYYDGLFSEIILQSLDEQLKLLKDFQELVTARYQGGQSNYLDVIRAKVEIARAGNELVEAKREARFRMRQLNLIIGQDADRRFELTDSLSYVPVTISRDTLVRDLLGRSSTLRIAQQFITRQHSALSLARTNYLPDFTLGLFYQRRAEEPPFNQNNFNGTTSKSLGLQIGVSVPLWFWQEPKGQVQEAAALIDIAAINLSKTERSIRANILSAIDLLQTIDAQVRTFDTTLLKDAKDILSTAVAQYQNNQIDVLNLFDVYRTYRATKVEYARALSNYMIALADLESAGELPSQE